jgi:hypothetical protein
MAMAISVLGKTIEQLKGHIQPGTKGLTLIKVRFLPSSSLPLPSTPALLIFLSQLAGTDRSYSLVFPAL